MKTTPFSRAHKGFTLIELLTVIAIIGILAAIIIPAVGNVRVKAAQAASASNLKQIALAYNNFAIAGARSQTIRSAAPADFIATSPEQWAQILAAEADLNDGSLYFIASADDVAGRPVPKVIVDATDSLTSDFSSAAGYMSYAVAVNVSPNAQSSVTPLIWTKGLDGGTGPEWNANKELSPWGDDGGHIAFLDGHVQFYQTLGASPAEGELIDPTAGTRTNDIQVAAGAAANVFTPAP